MMKAAGRILYLIILLILFPFPATGAGHYIYRKKWVSGKWTNKNLVISSPKYLKEQKTLVRRALKRHGKCTIILEATINDVHKSSVSFEKESLESILRKKKVTNFIIS